MFSLWPKPKHVNLRGRNSTVLEVCTWRHRRNTWNSNDLGICIYERPLVTYPLGYGPGSSKEQGKSRYRRQSCIGPASRITCRGRGPQRDHGRFFELRYRPELVIYTRAGRTVPVPASITIHKVVRVLGLSLLVYEFGDIFNKYYRYYRFRYTTYLSILILNNLRVTPSNRCTSKF